MLITENYIKESFPNETGLIDTLEKNYPNYTGTVRDFVNLDKVEAPYKLMVIFRMKPNIAFLWVAKIVQNYMLTDAETIKVIEKLKAVDPFDKNHRGDLEAVIEKSMNVLFSTARLSDDGAYPVLDFRLDLLIEVLDEEGL